MAGALVATVDHIITLMLKALCWNDGLETEKSGSLMILYSHHANSALFPDFSLGQKNPCELIPLLVLVLFYA